MATESSPEPQPVKLEALPELSELRPENFQAQAEDIIATLNNPEGRRMGLAEARELYVNQETDPRLKKFSFLLVESARAIVTERHLNQVRDLIWEVGGDEHLYEEEDKFRNVIIKYNHLLRDTIYENPGMFAQSQLVDWLGSASRDPEWASRLVFGMGAEVALKREVDAVPGVRGRFATVEEEKRGVDLIVIGPRGQREYDVKAAGSGFGGGEYGELVLEPFMRNGFRVKKEFQRGFRSEFSRLAAQVA